MNVIKRIFSIIIGKSRKAPRHDIEHLLGKPIGSCKTDHFKAIALAIQHDRMVKLGLSEKINSQPTTNPTEKEKV